MPKQGKKNDQDEPDEGPSQACAPGTKGEARTDDKLEELTGLVKSLTIQVSRMQQQVNMMSDEQRTELDTRDEIRRPGRGDDDNGGYGDFDDPEEMMSQTSWEGRPQRDPKLLPLSPDDDIEHFLMTFERKARCVAGLKMDGLYVWFPYSLVKHAVLMF